MVKIIKNEPLPLFSIKPMSALHWLFFTSPSPTSGPSERLSPHLLSHSPIFFLRVFILVTFMYILVYNGQRVLFVLFLSFFFVSFCFFPLCEIVKSFCFDIFFYRALFPSLDSLWLWWFNANLSYLSKSKERKKNKKLNIGLGGSMTAPFMTTCLIF